MKNKIQKFHNNSFTKKQLRKTITHRFRLKNIFNIIRTPKTWNSYKKSTISVKTFSQKQKNSILKILILRI